MNNGRLGWTAVQTLWKQQGARTTGTSTVTQTNSTTAAKRFWTKLLVGAGLIAGTTTGVALASHDVLVPVPVHWSHHGIARAYDCASIRRGFEVYRNVCSTCHAMKYIEYRNLIGVSHTHEHAKALAKSVMIEDQEPGDDGEMFERPGNLSDGLKKPYANDQVARNTNNGALPPDLSCISEGRDYGIDYIFNLLTCYGDPPAGVEIREGMYYNRYFPGGAISMAPPLMDEQVEFEDGTIATKSQMAKDVCTFLAWSCVPHETEIKKTAYQLMTVMGGLVIFSGWVKRRMWSVVKYRNVSYRPCKPYRTHVYRRK